MAVHPPDWPRPIDRTDIMDETPRPSPIPAILANLAIEIRRPLDELQGGLAALLGDPGRSPSDVERGHATTMLALCEELRKLTDESLTGTPADDDQDV